jgi:putative endopeptidase
MHKLMLPLLIVAIVTLLQCKPRVHVKTDVLASHIDTTVSPAEDFFAYAHGKWLKSNPIPDEFSTWGISDLVVEENLKRIRKILEDAAAANLKPGSNEQMIGDFWTAAMDSARIEAEGLKSLQPWLDRIDSVKDLRSLFSTVADLKKIGSYTFFIEYVAQDDKNSDAMCFRLWQGGIGLPDREYYLKTDSATIAIRNAYVSHIAKMLMLAGEDSIQASRAASNVLSFETKLAKASRKLEDLRDPYLNYNKMSISELSQLNKRFDWPTYLQDYGVGKIDSVIVGQPDFFRSLDQVLINSAIADLRSYVKYNLLQDFSVALPKKFGDQAFEFNRLLMGTKQKRPRWKQVITSAENAMGELLGQLYVREYFTEKARQRYDKMVEDVREALRDRISALTWMSDSTKQKAYAKLSAIKKKVGYPQKWKDFSGMKISRDSWLFNIMNANSWWTDYQLSKIGKPVDRDAWDMYPQTYNAYYNASNNEIVLPAGIFTVPGYRDEELDDATVYGYAGASTIGHEITHGFDDQGRLFDARGNLVSWWTKNDEAEFNKRAKLIIEQFDQYEPIPGYHINGKATTGENIADLGGVLLGLQAYKKTKEFKAGKTVEGLTPVQRYFLGYSMGWMENIRDEQLRNYLLTDVHSPAKYRVNGPFSNIEEFYSAFNVKPGNRMYRPDSNRVKIW